MKTVEEILSEIDKRIDNLYITANKPGYSISENVASAYALIAFKDFIQSESERKKDVDEHYTPSDLNLGLWPIKSMTKEELEKVYPTCSYCKNRGHELEGLPDESTPTIFKCPQCLREFIEVCNHEFVGTLTLHDRCRKCGEIK